MSTVIRELLAKQLDLHTKLQQAEAFQASLDKFPSTTAMLRPIMGSGMATIGFDLTQRLLLGATEDIASELAQVDMKIGAINTLLAN
jgi:hypothetical protein